ncbi:MAG: glycerophosphodiester phosphodiesterase [Propionibacteriaceae bacterium]|jgi:glycerophosphoryl diester phosphodiesterase|nr:glycerophosphodiester phosphodiesterase [Propionibacteriaceae bacterium]
MAYLDPPFLAIAHRGGSLHPANIGHENTLEAFQVAADLGYRYFETDVHATSDGVLVAFHDNHLDRVTDGAGSIREFGYSQLRRLRVGGEYRIPTLLELLEAFPDARFNIDIKSEGAERPLAEVIAETGCHERVLVTSFSWSRLRKFRKLMDRPVAIGAGSLAVAAQLAAFKAGWAAHFSQAAALQVPVRRMGIQVVDAKFVRLAHASGYKVHVWTIDNPAQMGQLIDLGVDGIITDRIDVLKDVLLSRGLWFV